jgi:hypothetical protein
MTTMPGVEVTWFGNIWHRGTVALFIRDKQAEDMNLFCLP